MAPSTAAEAAIAWSYENFSRGEEIFDRQSRMYVYSKFKNKLEYSRDLLKSSN